MQQQPEREQNRAAGRAQDEHAREKVKQIDSRCGWLAGVVHGSHSFGLPSKPIIGAAVAPERNKTNRPIPKPGTDGWYRLFRINNRRECRTRPGGRKRLRAAVDVDVKENGEAASALNQPTTGFQEIFAGACLHQRGILQELVDLGGVERLE